MIEFDENEVLKLEVQVFVSLHLHLKPILEMGEKNGRKWLEKKYHEFERKKRANTSDKPVSSVRKVRKR